MPKEYTRDEFTKSLLDLWEGDPAGLARTVLQINPWINACMIVAEYRNGMLSPASYFDRRYRPYAPGKEIPAEIADSQGLSARYRLEGVYKLNSMGLNPKAALDLPEMLKELKIPRPAVAYIRTSADQGGAERQGYAVYRDQKLIEFVREDAGLYYEDRLKELGADKDWATGKIKVSEDVWDEITNEDNWPVSSNKFSSHRAERLYSYTLDSGQDDEIGDMTIGSWYALFKGERAVLETTSQGFVSVTVYETDDEMERAWDVLVNEWSDDEEEA